MHQTNKSKPSVFCSIWIISAHINWLVSSCFVSDSQLMVSFTVLLYFTLEGGNAILYTSEKAPVVGSIFFTIQSFLNQCHQKICWSCRISCRWFQVAMNPIFDFPYVDAMCYAHVSEPGFLEVTAYSNGWVNSLFYLVMKTPLHEVVDTRID